MKHMAQLGQVVLGVQMNFNVLVVEDIDQVRETALFIHWHQIAGWDLGDVPPRKTGGKF
ncbi:hypothetical protein D3C74_393220 [compost metagenome]